MFYPFHLICFCRVDEESSKRSDLEKVKREMENQIEELRDDLEAEKSARTKAEKQRREHSEVMQVPRISSNFCNCNFLPVKLGGVGR